MANFRKKFYPDFTRHYSTIGELQSNPPDSDCYLVGSDQVWNPDISKTIGLAYFLDFGKDEVRRISYASSFGKNRWTLGIQETNKIKFLLERFFALSVREEEGQKLCSEIFNLTPKLVVDPTLLLSDFSDIIGTISDKREIVCYKLNRNDDFFNNIQHVSRELNLPIRLINNVLPIRGIKYTYPPDIRQWIKLIGGASFVITDSYHGVVFCLIYKRNFAAIANHNGLDSRISSLLLSVGLANRFYDNVESLSKDKSWKTSIDFKIVDEKIENLRNDSLIFLKDALKTN